MTAIKLMRDHLNHTVVTILNRGKTRHFRPTDASLNRINVFVNHQYWCRNGQLRPLISHAGYNTVGWLWEDLVTAPHLVRWACRPAKHLMGCHPLLTLTSSR